MLQATEKILWGVAGLVLALQLFAFNYALAPSQLAAIHGICYLLIAIYCLQTVLIIRALGRRFFDSYELIVRIVILGAVAITFARPMMAAGLILMEEAVRITGVFLRNVSSRGFFDRLRTNPGLFISSTFLSAIAVGAILLSLPIATTAGQITFIDALFTATSAVCVTGLIVQDTGTFFTTFGQCVILGLFQIGGLGIMTMSTSLALLAGRRMSMQDRVIMQEMVPETHYTEFSDIVRNIVRMTIICEAVGTLLLAARWYFDSHDLHTAIYSALFHAVSAFCNAGFSLFPDSMVRYQTDPITNLTISALIIIGGLGFTVVHSLVDRHRPTLHMKMVLMVSATLLFGGMLFILLAEYSHSLIHLPFHDKLWVAWFQSVTARTAGFNTIDLSHFSTVTAFLCCILMFIGASPGSCGGGIKTTTVGVLFFSVRSMLAGRTSVEGFGRTIPWSAVRKAIAITFLAGGILTIGVVLLLFSDGFGLLETLFEATSAMGTVGLSLGITAKLTAVGKLVITCLMFVGRIGPLTTAFLMVVYQSPHRYRLPEENIGIG